MRIKGESPEFGCHQSAQKGYLGESSVGQREKFVCLERVKESSIGNSKSNYFGDDREKGFPPAGGTQ